jgi:hypothetical protein
MYTRSQKSAIARQVPVARVIQYSKDQRRWTVSEEREMIRLRRHENMSFHEIATELHRSPDAIKYRFEKLLMEHTDGCSNTAEALRWFNLSDE